MAKWRLSSTEPRNDGTGTVAFDIFGLDDTGSVIPGKHITVLLSDTDITTATATGTATQKRDKIKALISAALPAEWQNAPLNSTVAKNTAAITAKGKVDALVPGGVYPIDFTL